MKIGPKGSQGPKQETLKIVVSMMTPDQIDEAQRMAGEWMAKHQQ